MKIEKISENKIKCTLNREDLESHNIVLTEFAYGSEKAREFFRELMLQAEDEVGFEAEDIPLMIEAIPVNQDCIVLFVTKVSDPEELDTRFSRFSTSDNDAEEDSEEEEELESLDVLSGDEDFIGAVTDAVKSAVEGLSKAVGASGTENGDGFIPLPDTVPKVGAKKEEKKPVKEEHTFVYLFPTLEDVCGVAQYLKDVFCGDNTLYKDMIGNKYYLVISNGGVTAEEFAKVTNVLSEFGKRQKTSYAKQAYYEEHYLCVIRSNALQTLGAM